MQKRPKGWETARDDPNHVGELLITIDGTQYTGEDIASCEIERDLLENTVEVGNATAAVLTLEINQKGTIAKRAKVVVQYRLVLDDAKTDYIPQGTYWINMREASGRYLKLTCYDAMLMGQQNYLSDTTADDWPKQESDCVAEIAQRIGVELDSRNSIGTGDNHTVSMPVGRTMRDVLQQIGAANGGNWCITPAGKLHLVPLAGTGDSLPEVSGAPDCGANQSVTGVRVVRNSADTPLLSGDETGTVLEVENENGTQDLADELAQKLKGMNYAPYTCDQRHIDPVAEAGDKITIGGTAYVAYNIKMTLGPSHYADLEAPAEAGELEEEYPYLSETKRTQKELETVTKSVSEIRKDQEKIETEVSETKKTVAETQEDIEAARKEAEEKSELAAKQAKEYTDGQLLNYSTTEETKSLIQQTKDSITSEVSKTYATTATVKKAQQDAQDYTDGQLIHYSTTEETKSLIKQTADSITSEVSKTYATTKTVEDAQQAATGEAKKYTDGKLVSYSTTEETKSLIKQSADSIASEVSKTYATTKTVEDAQQAATGEAKKYTDNKLKDYATNTSVSKIEQKADSITQTVNQRVTGGSNIIKGTDDWNNATLDAGGNDLSKKGTYTISGESVRVTNKAQNTRFHFGANTAMIIAKGVSYCASVLYKLNSGTNGLFLQFETKASDGTRTYYGTLFKQNQKDIDQGNGWYLRYAVFTATADGYADGLFVSTANDFATVTNDLTIMHPMVQMGNAPTGWTASTGDYMTATETKTEIKQELGTIKLTATTNGTSSTLTLAANGANITSANISFTGVVTFNDLSTWNQAKTIINGGNITTGQIHNLKYSTVYDLDNAYIRMGTESGERVYIDNRHIAWYATVNTGSIGLTGVCYSEAGRSYIGANSKYASYGWVDGLDPTKWVGLQVTYNRADDSDADFNTTRVGISGTLSCQNLNAWGSKSRVVNTSFGALKMAAFETPVPTFADWGHAECNADGWCLIVPDPRYAETVTQHGQLTWMLTDCDGTGHLWAEDCGQYAIVHGAPGQKFAWMCMAAQRGYEGEYAEPSECDYPAPPPEGMELAASAAARALDAGASTADDMLNAESAKTDDTLLEAEEQT